VEEGPAVTYPAPDLENMKETMKQDKFMKKVYQKELGEDFESLKDGVCTGEVRHAPLASMMPFEGEENV
jgi:hypothetical protein